MSLEKKYLLEKGVCKVAFRFPVYLAEKASLAVVVGDFNDWNPSGNPMRKTNVSSGNWWMEPYGKPNMKPTLYPCPLK